MRIKDKIIDLLKSDQVFQATVARDTGKSPSTVKYWAANKTEALLQLPTLQAICEYTKLPITEVVEGFPATEFQVKVITEKEAA